MRRDWLLLPLLGLASIAALGVTAELVSRHLFSESAERLATCLVLDDPANGVRGIPNSTCREKAQESALIEYRLDSAGFRSGFTSPATRSGMLRIVMVGSSVAMGERVQFPQTLAALLPQELSGKSGRPIELYNEGMAYGFARNVALRFPDALAAKPDVVLWLLTPLDVQLASVVDVKNAFGGPAHGSRAVDEVKTQLLTKLRNAGGDIVTGYALRHWLYAHERQELYVQSFLARGNAADSGFLEESFGPQWQAYLQEFATHAAQVAAQARRAGVPLIATLVPNHAQAAMIAAGRWPPGFDPYRLGEKLRSIIVGYGGTYVDILPDFRNVTNVGELYLPMDGHPNAAGHLIITQLLANRLAPVLPFGSNAPASAGVKP
ncbi:MAG TPA: hypothetical protein VGC34_07150 [Steroidobacteraceae bacterium]